MATKTYEITDGPHVGLRFEITHSSYDHLKQECRPAGPAPDYTHWTDWSSCDGDWIVEEYDVGVPVLLDQTVGWPVNLVDKEFELKDNVVYKKASELKPGDVIYGWKYNKNSNPTRTNTTVISLKPEFNETNQTSYFDVTLLSDGKIETESFGLTWRLPIMKI